MSATDVAGNSSKPVQAKVVLDRSKPETVPTDLSAGLGVSGKEVIVKWTADPNAHAYNLYRSEKPVSSLDGRIPIASRLTVNQFVDSGIDLDRTYYYALKSVSPDCV